MACYRISLCLMRTLKSNQNISTVSKLFRLVLAHILSYQDDILCFFKLSAGLSLKKNTISMVRASEL